MLLNLSSYQKDNRYEIREKINALSASGMTDIYSGWLASVEQVAKRLILQPSSIEFFLYQMEISLLVFVIMIKYHKM